MNVSIKQLSQIFKILRNLKNVKNNQQKILIQTVMEKNSTFQKIGTYVKEPCQLYMCAKFQVDILKMPDFWRFVGRNGHVSPYSRRFLHFSDFQILSDLGRSKSVLGSCFCVLDKNRT